MSGQNTLLVIAEDAQVKRPGHKWNWQVYRDTAIPGAGTYKAMDFNGVIEIIGGPGIMGGMITGGGTVNFIPKFSPIGTNIIDSSLFDNGNIGYGTILPNSVAAFDIVSTTKGILFPRMTTVQRDAIVTGASTDGLFIFNTTTEKFNFWNQTLGIWESIDTATGGDVSGSGTTGQLPVWTDGPNSILGDSGILAANVFVQNGNSFGANARLGTNDPFSLEFETSNIIAGSINTSQLWSIGGAAPIAGVRALITGTTNDNTTYALRIDSSLTVNNFVARNDGNIGIRTATPTGRLTIFSSNNNHISLSVDGGIADRYLLYLDSVTEDLHYQLNNANHLFYAGGGGAELVLTVGGGGATNGRVSIAPSTSADYQDWKLYVETSANNDRAIFAKTFGAGGAQDTAGYFEAVGAGTLNVAGYFSATGATKNYSIVSANGHVSMSSLQVGDAGLASGDVYVDTEANILANGDLILARVV